MQRIDVKNVKLYRDCVCMMVGSIIYFSLSRLLCITKKVGQEPEKGVSFCPCIYL